VDFSASFLLVVYVSDWSWKSVDHGDAVMIVASVRCHCGLCDQLWRLTCVCDAHAWLFVYLLTCSLTTLISYKVPKCWWFGHAFCWYWPTFTAHAQKRQFPSFLLQFWQRCWIQRHRFPIAVENFGNWKALTAILGHVSLRMRRIGIIYAYGPKPVATVILTDIDFL